MTSSLLKLSIILATIGLFSTCSKNANNANTNGARANTLITNQARPGDPARIEGDFPTDEILTAELKYLQTMDVPAVRFAFKTGKVEMPSGAKDILKTHWKEALKYYYDNYFNKPQDATSLYDRERAWTRYCNETDKKLQDVSVPAPDGSRAISAEEARGIHNFLNQAAEQVIDKAKAVK